MIQTPLPALIAARVRSWLKDDPRAPIGIGTSEPWRGGDSLEIDGRRIPVFWCRGPLEFRYHLSCHRDRPAVLLTDLDARELGDEVIGRLYNCSLRTLNVWDVVLETFRAREPDRLLLQQAWMPEILLKAAAETEGPAPRVEAAAHSLTADYAWGLLFRHYLGLKESRPDAFALIRWAGQPKAAADYAAAPEPFRRHLPDRLAESAGAIGRALIHCFEQGKGADVVALGLVCGILFAPEAQTEPELIRAVGRFEEGYAGGALGRDTALQWEAVVLDLLSATRGREEEAVVRGHQERAAAILNSFGVARFARLSDHLLLGFEQRLERLARELDRVLAGKGSLAEMETCALSLLRHQEAHRREDRLETVRMALRLARRLENEPVPAPGFPAAVSAYGRDGGFVDWARRIIRFGDSQPLFQRVLTDLEARAGERRELENRRFGQLLANWSPNPTLSGEVLFIESILDKVVTPLLEARQNVLLLVLDGMNLPAFRELLADLADRNWLELAQEHKPFRFALAVFPTTTEHSRASLVHGRLVSGVQADEKKGFANSGLRKRVNPDYPPVLFHKKELTEPGGEGLSKTVRQAVKGSKHRVLGVVVNTIDDHLDKSSQLGIRWRADSIHPLVQLLDGARAAGRTVVLTSDHGHILDWDMESRRHSGSKPRYRAAGGEPGEGEILLRGPRVLASGNAVIAPWSEALRYGGRSWGFHGGVSPREAVVPLAVLVSVDDRVPEGWQEVRPYYPEWWHAPETEPVSKRTAPSQRPGPRLVQEQMFQAPATPATITGKLLASPLFKQRHGEAARVAADDERIRKFLEALASRGGTMTQAGLARAMRIPDQRLPGFLSGMVRVLNVDGYAVLEITGENVILSFDLLAAQFELNRQ